MKTIKDLLSRILKIFCILFIFLIGAVGCSNLNKGLKGQISALEPFPLDDKNAKYQLEKIGNQYALTYLKDHEQPLRIYVSSDTKMNLEEYIGKNLEVTGKYVQEQETNIECIKAPCGQLIVTVIRIDTVRVEEDTELTMGWVSDNVPDSIIKKTDEFIISKIGKSRFDSWVKFQNGNRYLDSSSVCTSGNPSCIHYQVSYGLKVPEKPFVDYGFAFELDGNGHITSLQLPNCIANEQECDFPIDEANAIEIAKKLGLEKGVSDWKVTFNFMDETFIWQIQNTLVADRIGEANGKIMSIDANSGDVLGIDAWKSMS